MFFLTSKFCSHEKLLLLLHYTYNYFNTIPHNITSLTVELDVYVNRRVDPSHAQKGRQRVSTEDQNRQKDLSINVRSGKNQ